jgi:hypothetical protein
LGIEQSVSKFNPDCSMRRRTRTDHSGT